MIRVAAYCRVSTDKDDQVNSFENQQRYFRECIQRNPDWELQEIYADEGLSGTNTKKRKRFNEMIQAARERKLDLIITKEISRFARNTVDTLAYTRELRMMGIGVIFLLDNINTLDADGELRLTIMASMAQEESRKTSGRVKWGQKRRMEQGVVFGGSLLGYDVKDGKISVNPEGAKIVRCIFHKYLDERKGSSVIARELRAEGIPSSRGNLKWSAPTVLKILKNEKYCGDLIQKKTYTPDYLSHAKKYNKGQEEFVVLRDHHAPIIDRETWDAVQRELHRRRIGDTQGSGHGSRYPLSGKIKCGDCGSSFVARKKKRKSGAVYKVWRCGRATTQGKLHTDANGAPAGCDVGRQLREDTAMDILRQAVETVQMDREGVIGHLTRVVEDVLKDGQDKLGPKKRRLERELEAVQEKKEKAVDAYLDAAINKQDLQFMNERCDACIEQIQNQLTAIEKRTALDTQSKAIPKDIQAAIRGIINGETADDDFYGRLLHHMTVFNDGRVEVALNLLPARWYFLLDGLAEFQRQLAVHDGSSVPRTGPKKHTLPKRPRNQGVPALYHAENPNVPITGYLYSMEIEHTRARKKDKPRWRLDACAALPEGGELR